MLPTLLKLCVLAKNDPFFDHAHSLSYCHFENFQNLQFYYTFLHGKQQYKYNQSIILRKHHVIYFRKAFDP